MLFRKLAISALLTLTAFAGTGCTIVSVDEGEEAVLIDKPWFTPGPGGARNETVKPGLELTYFSTQVRKFRTTPQVVKVQIQDFSSSDNILLDFETVIQYRIKSGPQLLRKFGNFDPPGGAGAMGPEWFENNVRAQYIALVREEVKKHTMKEMMSSSEVAGQVDDSITTAIQKHIATAGLPIEILGISLGRAQPNPEVLTQMNLTAAEQQRKLTLEASTAAEEQRKLEQEKKAEADSAYRTKLNLSMDDYVTIRVAQLQVEACKEAKECVIAPPGSSVLVGR